MTTIDSDLGHQAAGNDGNYTYTNSRRAVTYSLTDEARDQMLTEGSTQEEIDQEIREANESSESMVGTVQTCVYTDTEPMIEAINEWQNLRFSTDDLAFAECEDTYEGVLF